MSQKGPFLRRENSNYFLISTFSEFAYDGGEKFSKKCAPDSSGIKKGKRMIHSIISKVLLCFFAAVVGVGLIFLILALQRSTLPYNSEGNYFDGVVNYHEQSIMVYGILAGASFLCAIMLFAIRLFLQRSQQTALGKPPTVIELSS